MSADDTFADRVRAAATWQIENGEPWPGYNTTLDRLLESLGSLVETQCDEDSPYVTQGGNMAASRVYDAIDLMLSECEPLTDEEQVPW